MVKKEEAVLSGISFLVRVIVMVYGSYQDEKVGLHYTDIDYGVFSDASAFIFQGESPYKRPTYRYTPLLACLLLPNSYLGPFYGKTLFIFCDWLTGILIRSLSDFSCKSEEILSYALWDFNPFVINISTRGNCDSITCFLIVLTLYLFKRSGNVFLSALVFGISVHLRIFPAFFVPSLFFYLKWKVIPFGIISFSTFLALNLYFFGRYKEDFLTETYLYHLSRIDYKHNFAAPWLPVFLGENPAPFWSASRLILIAIVSYFLRDRIELCWAAIVIIFIGYNQVCTVQYFDWAFALFALIPKELFNRRFFFSTVVWLVAHVAWLICAYFFEMRGFNIYVPLWIFSLGAFIGNNALLSALMQPKAKEKEE